MNNRMEIYVTRNYNYKQQWFNCVKAVELIFTDERKCIVKYHFDVVKTKTMALY